MFDHIGPIDLTIADATADVTSASAIRRRVTRWLAAVPLDENTKADITLAVYEAVANVVQHAYRHEGAVGTVSVHARYQPAKRNLDAVVADNGRWNAPAGNKRGGYGLPLIRTLATDTAIDRTDSGTSVLMRWVLPPFAPRGGRD